MKPICFYHKADLDGVCSGAIVKHFVPDVELYGFDYGEEFPWALVLPLERRAPISDVIDADKIDRRTVYMVDVSLPPEDMRRLAEVSNLVFIDHHMTALFEATVSKLGFAIAGLRDIRWSACELAWKYFSNLDRINAASTPDAFLEASFDALHSDVPEAVRLLGRYDVWDKDHPEWESKILPFQYAIRAEEGIYDPKCLRWRFLFGVDGYSQPMSNYIEAPWLDHAIERGAAILRYQAEVNRRACETGAHEIVIKTPATAQETGGVTGVLRWWPAIACNTIVFNSQFFEGFFDPEKHDVMCAYAQMSDGRWKVSLYSTKPDIDCGVICKTFGGGGHKQAAGFICDKLPWEKQ